MNSMIVAPGLALFKALSIFKEQGGNGNVKNGSDLLCEFANKDLGFPTEMTDELKWLVSADKSAINKFLGENGFLELENEFRPGMYGIVTILKLLLEWITQPSTGDYYRVRFRDRWVEGIKFSHDYTVYQSRHATIVKIKTKSETRNVCFALTYEGAPAHSLHCLSKILELKNCVYAGVPADPIRANGVRVPKLHLSYIDEIPYVLGLQNDRDDLIITSQEQVKLKLDENGVKIQQAVFLGILSGSIYSSEPMPEIVIDRPFYFWVEDDEYKIPIFGAYIYEVN